MSETDPLNYKWLDLAIQSGLALHQYQLKLLLRLSFLENLGVKCESTTSASHRQNPSVLIKGFTPPPVRKEVACCQQSKLFSLFSLSFSLPTSLVLAAIAFKVFTLQFDRIFQHDNANYKFVVTYLLITLTFNSHQFLNFFT